MSIIQIPLEDVIFDESLYPRQQFDQDVISQYRQGLDKLPPIEITHENLLIDGYHRLIAFRIEQRETIPAIVENLDKSEVLWESTKRNAMHGFQLSQKDKQKLGRLFYRGEKSLYEIANVLSVTEKTIFNWTQDLRQAEKEERNQKIWDMWLTCKTLEEIAEKMKISIGNVHKTIDIFKNRIISNSENQAQNQPDSLQIFNLWNFHDNDDRYGMDYPGRIPGQIIENILYYYTNLFDIIIDPMCGSGTALDVCKAMDRRYRVYDLNPVRDDIKKHDITVGFPSETKGGNLIFLDPPYWSQRQGKYSKDETNLANLSLSEFYKAMEFIFESAYDVLKSDGYIALIIGPTQQNRVIYDHAFECAKLLEKKFKFVNRVIVPYTTQQAQAYHVTDAREAKYTLKLYRDLLVYQKQ